MKLKVARQMQPPATKKRAIEKGGVPEFRLEMAKTIINRLETLIEEFQQNKNEKLSDLTINNI